MPKALAKSIKKQDKTKIKAAVSNINNLKQQKKAFAFLVGLNVLTKYLKEQDIGIISENNNYSDLLMLNDYDIANITLENNKKIAVRAVVGDNYSHMCIPKAHFSNNILADIYVGIRLEASIEKAELIGFIESVDINKENSNHDYVFINSEQLRPINTLIEVISVSFIYENIHENADHQKAEELFFQYIEDRISTRDKEFFVRHISSCSLCSKAFNNVIELDNLIKAAGAEFDEVCFDNDLAVLADLSYEIPEDSEFDTGEILIDEVQNENIFNELAQAESPLEIISDEIVENSAAESFSDLEFQGEDFTVISEFENLQEVFCETTENDNLIDDLFENNYDDSFEDLLEIQDFSKKSPFRLYKKEIVDTAGKLAVISGAIAGKQILNSVFNDVVPLNFVKNVGDVIDLFSAENFEGSNVENKFSDDKETDFAENQDFYEAADLFSVENTEGSYIENILSGNQETGFAERQDLHEEADLFSVENTEGSYIENILSGNHETGFAEHQDLREEADLFSVENTEGSYIENILSGNQETGFAERQDLHEEADLFSVENTEGSYIENILSGNQETGFAEHQDLHEEADLFSVENTEDKTLENLPAEEIKNEAPQEEFFEIHDVSSENDVFVDNTELPEQENNNELFIIKEEETSEVCGHETAFEIPVQESEDEIVIVEAQHKDVSDISVISQENMSVQEPVLVFLPDEVSVDDNIANFDDVEIVDPFELLSNNNQKLPEIAESSESAESVENIPKEELKLQEEVNENITEKESIINEIFEKDNSVSEKHQGIVFSVDESNEESNEENIEVQTDLINNETDEEPLELIADDEQTEEVFEKVKLFDLKELKMVTGIAAAGIIAAVAIFVWVNKQHNAQNVSDLKPPATLNKLAEAPVPQGTVKPDLTAQSQNNNQQQPQNIPPVPEQDVQNQAPLNNNLNSVLAEAFTRRTSEVDIRNISWEITSEMAENPVFRNYIMVTGQALKSALSRDLAMANERATRDKMQIKTVMDLSGNILETTVMQSSGSSEVDKICLNTYRTTLQFTKLPKIQINKDKIKANLIISF